MKRLILAAVLAATAASASAIAAPKGNDFAASLFTQLQRDGS